MFPGALLFHNRTMVMGADEAIGAGQGEAAGPVEVFVSYDPKDEPLLLELEASLDRLDQSGRAKGNDMAAKLRAFLEEMAAYLPKK